VQNSTRKTAQTPAEAALDGIYVVRTSVTSERLDRRGVVEAYKGLKVVEADFCCLNRGHGRIEHHYVSVYRERGDLGDRMESSETSYYVTAFRRPKHPLKGSGPTSAGTGPLRTGATT